jgi:hypothetical protein
MANKTITQLSPVASVEAADEFEVQKSGETITKKATLTQVTQVEVTARAAQDDTIEYAVGLETDGTYPSSDFEDSWYMRTVDHQAILDRSGIVEDLPLTIVNALRIIDAKINELNSVTSNTDVVNATFKSPGGSSGNFHCFGFYEAPAAHKVFTNAAATQTLGTANVPYSAHVFLVAKETPAAPSGGSTGTAKITVTGTSITDNGVRTGADSEIIVADITTLTANKYVQTQKCWIGQVTITIAATGNHTTFSATCNYGLAAPYIFNEEKVQIYSFEATGRGGAADTGFNVELLKHSSTGWVYSAAAFIPGGTVICSLSADLITEKNLANGIRFKYFRDDLDYEIDGTYEGENYGSHTNSEGVVVRITTSQNNAIESSDYRINFIYL